MPFAVAAVTKSFPGDMQPGDIFITNDPYDGSTHLPDVALVKPVFLKGEHVAFSVTLGHQTDIGGRVPAGNACDSTEIYQEGLRIPPCKIFEAGKENTALLRIIERNVRVPDVVIADIRALISATLLGERQLLKLITKHGMDQFQAYCEELLDYAERYTRAEIEKLPKGRYEFTDYIDNDGIDPDPIKIQVAITVESDSMIIDFTGTSRQARGAINSVYPFTFSTVMASLRPIFDLNIPNNSGFFRPFKLIAPERSIVNPVAPAPVAARGLTSFRVSDAVFGALAQIAPDKIPACGSWHPEVGFSFGGYDKDGKPFVYLEFPVGSWGGGPHRDGMDACTGMITNYSNTPGEVLESEHPLVLEANDFIPDTGGAGKFRGGLSMERRIRFVSDEAILQIRSDRGIFPTYGLKGGQPGALCRVILVRADGKEEAFPGKFLTTVKKGDFIRIRLAGGGGYGDPLEREPEKVLWDVLEGKVTVDGAKKDYKVVIGGNPPKVLEKETRLLRSRATS
jgi:N-methylhydantoinase B